MNRETSFFKRGVGIFLLGTFLGELSPDPTDPLHFLLQHYIFKHPELSRQTFILLQIFDWYILSALWFLFVMAIAYILHIRKVSTVKIIFAVGGILGVGAVLGILFNLLLGSA